MNILCVGNSFAVDTSTYVHQIAEAMGLDININVLYIGGCPIDLHWKNFLSKDKPYELYENGNRNPVKWCDIFEGLTYRKYDFITFQQRSGDSCDASTFFPELTNLMKGIRDYSDATYLLHKTWSYSKNFSHERYGSNPMDQAAMDRDIKEAYIEVSKKSGIPYIIPSGEAIKLAREKYGDVLDRDGYHLNEMGRTLCGILWVFFLTGRTDLDANKFIPSGHSYDDTTEGVSKDTVKDLIDIAKKALENNKGYNLYGKM
ncbi:MAG: DUF4886 domain-containing protein [Gammaproteobacteria bacterium]|nr:DUF4886 domain-containing protein [Gammaproteobacteria bacterium]